METRRDVALTSWLLFVALGLSACGSIECPPEGLQTAAHYPNNVNIRAGLMSARDRWVRNPGAEAFLRTALRSERATTLADKHGMQCTAQPSAGCTDCYVCDTAFPFSAISMSNAIPFMFAPRLSCTADGEVFLRAEIGPGDSVTAMTFWQTPKKDEKK